MDRIEQPKLTLVESPFSTEDFGNPHDNHVGGNELLIDACDLEGEEVEEIQEETFDAGIVFDIGDVDTVETNQYVTGKMDIGVNVNIDAGSYFASMGCAECGTKECSRSVTENNCGHVKCRSCYMSSEDACRQCIQSMQIDTRQNEAVLPQESEATDTDTPVTVTETSTDENVHRIVVKPNQYVLEFGEVSGKKSVAIVSADILKELGLQHLAKETDAVEPKTELEDSTSTDFDTVALGAADDTSDTYQINTQSAKSKKKKATKSILKMDHIIVIDDDESTKGDKKYKCLKCKAIMPDSKHHRTKHAYCDPDNGDPPFTCPECSAKFVVRHHFLYHHRVHTGERPYECPICKKRFIQKVKLNRHIATAHTTKRIKLEKNTSTYLCAFCSKSPTFRNMSSCVRHIKQHFEVRKFKCSSPKCLKTFKTQTQLRIHKMTHSNGRPYTCLDCGKGFTIQKDLKRHSLCHTGEMPFPCELCNTRFRRNDNLKRHIENTHGVSADTAKTLAAKSLMKYKQELKERQRSTAQN